MSFKISTMREDTQLLRTCSEVVNDFENAKLVRTEGDQIYLHMVKNHRMARRILGNERIDILEREYDLVTNSSVVPIILPSDKFAERFNVRVAFVVCRGQGTHGCEVSFGLFALFLGRSHRQDPSNWRCGQDVDPEMGSISEAVSVGKFNFGQLVVVETRFVGQGAAVA